MSAAKHTQGPWRVCAAFGSAGGIRHEGGFVAFPCDPRAIDESRADGESWIDMRERTKPLRESMRLEQSANARLIAAAPELLEALRDCLSFLESDMPTVSSGPERRKAAAAIAKATGEQA